MSEPNPDFYGSGPGGCNHISFSSTSSYGSLHQEELQIPNSGFLLAKSINIDKNLSLQDSSREMTYQSWKEMYVDSFASEDVFDLEKLLRFNNQVQSQTISDYSQSHVTSAMEQEMNIQCQFPEIAELKKEIPNYQFPTPHLETICNSTSTKHKPTDEALSTEECKNKLSTEDIIRLASERYIQFASQRVSNSPLMFHPYNASTMVLSSDEMKDVELVWFLLSAAESVGYQQYDTAMRLLNRCDWIASDTGNPVQRIVFYYAEALRIKIGKETGRKFTVRKPEEGQIQGKSLVLGSSFSFIVLQLGVPFQSVMQYPGMQAIIEIVEKSNIIHLIDLQIRDGLHWTILMKALAERDDHPIKTLKITAIGTKSRQDMEGTCQRLATFAKSLSLPLTYDIIFLSNMKDFNAQLIKSETEENLVVYFPTILRSMISRPQVLDNLMNEIKKLKPNIMAVNEVEANHNSPSFFKRFIESLFYHSVYFDSFEDCLKESHKYRMSIEGVYFRDGIRDIVSNEGEERLSRSVKMGVWRKFFARFGMEEVELSESAFYQAELVKNQFACGSSCLIQKNGKCLIIGWKGTPLHSLSLWRFCSLAS